jgi:CRP-like cAMP-binding protein
MTTILAAEIKKIGDFSDADIDLFISFLKESFLQKGDYFLKEGQVSRHLAYTLSGLTMHFKTADGIEIPCDFTSEGQWLSYPKSFTSGLPADMAIKALEDTRLLKLSVADMQQLFQVQPKFMAINHYYTERTFISNTRHCADLAMLNAAQRYTKFRSEKPELINRVPQYAIAAYLGIKPQSLSRIRKEG